MESELRVAVTGAAGKTGRAVMRALVRRGVRVRAFVRSEAQAEIARAAGAAEVIEGDLRDGGALAQTVQGCETVYHICPNMSPDEVQIGGVVIAAVRGAGARLVYHSVLHPQVEAMPHHWAKLRVEEALFAANVRYTILQPEPYMQNLLAQRERVWSEGVYAVPYAAETVVGMVDLEDVAEAAARVLAEPGHECATYELACGEALDAHAVAALLASACGRPVRALAEDRAGWAARARAQGMGAYAVETLLAMFAYYERHEFRGNPTVLRALIGREPASFARFAARVFAREAG